MTKNSCYYYIFNYNKFTLINEEKNVLLTEPFRQEHLNLNGFRVVFNTKWYDPLIFRKRAEIISDSSVNRVTFKLKSFSGVWSFFFDGDEFQFHLLKGYKSKLVSKERLISTIDTFNAAKLGYMKKWAFTFSCENDYYLILILICIILFVTVENLDGLISPQRNLIGKNK